MAFIVAIGRQKYDVAQLIVRADFLQEKGKREWLMLVSSLPKQSLEKLAQLFLQFEEAARQQETHRRFDLRKLRQKYLMALIDFKEKKIKSFLKKSEVATRRAELSSADNLLRELD